MNNSGKAARIIQSRTDRMGKNQNFKARAQSIASKINGKKIILDIIFRF